jgi:hypothetical protein
VCGSLSCKILSTRGNQPAYVALAYYLEDQVAKGSLPKMNLTAAARQIFDLVAAEMTMEAHVPSKPKPTDRWD